ncbi:MAG: metallophosphoesterase [Acidimicrobiaceae bacterium]|nr:metallophosphoesterase [Acidimicrobiaceae bacterium]
MPGPTGATARLLVAGDTHGNLGWLSELAALAEEQRCEGIIQLGDFGFWPDPKVLRECARVVLNEGWLTAVADALASHDVWLRVIDGNHDFHPGALAAHPPDGRGIAVVRDDRLDWATRGARWEWCGVRFGALGGAYSIDKMWREPGVTWWETERITDAQRDLLGAEPLDVLLTHDAPQGVGWPEVDVGGPKVDPASRANREQVERARRATRPSVLLHGHYHLRYRTTMSDPGTRVEGLAADIQADGGSWGVLELPGLVFADGDHL